MKIFCRKASEIKTLSDGDGEKLRQFVSRRPALRNTKGSFFDGSKMNLEGNVEL